MFPIKIPFSNKNIISSVPFAILVVLSFLLIILCLFKFDDIIIHVVLIFWFVYFLKFVMDEEISRRTEELNNIINHLRKDNSRITKEISRRTEELNNIIYQIKKENERLSETQLSDLVQFGEWKKDTMGKKDNRNIETETNIS